MIEVGEYIRTPYYTIEKVERIDKAEKNIYEDMVVTDESCYGMSWLLNNKTKHSKDILDLIKKDDYINGTRVEKITKNYITIGNATFGRKGLKGIKSIVTKEAYKNIEYRL